LSDRLGFFNASYMVGIEWIVRVAIVLQHSDLSNNEVLSPIINRSRLLSMGATLGLCLSIGAAYADNYSDTVTVFKNAGESASLFENSYAYAVFPSIGEGGFVVGGAHGDGRVYVPRPHSYPLLQGDRRSGSVPSVPAANEYLGVASLVPSTRLSSRAKKFGVLYE
jgi:hypothetical protein